MDITSRERVGLGMIAVGILIFFWSIWLTAMFYILDIPHPPEGWSMSQYGLIAAIMMAIGSVLFGIGAYLALTPKEEEHGIDTRNQQKQTQQTQ